MRKISTPVFIQYFWVKKESGTPKFVMCEMSQGNTIDVWFHTQRKDGANTTSIRCPQKNVIAIIMLYKNKKLIVCWLDRVTNFFEIVTGVLERDILASHMFIVCQDYVLWMSIDLRKWFKKEKKMTSHSKYDKWRLHWWSCASHKYTRPSQIPTVLSGANGNQTWPIKWNAVSSRQRLCRYCYMDALLGR